MSKKALVPVVADRVAAVIADLAELSTEAKRAGERERFRAACAGLVFSYWQAKLDHQRARFDRKRERLLMQRLKEADDDVSELLYAIDGALKDDWTMGRSPRTEGRRYDGLEVLFRDRAHVEKFAEKVGAYRRGEPHPMAAKYLGAKES